MVNKAELVLLAVPFLTPTFTIISECINAPSLFALHPAANAIAFLICFPAAVIVMLERKSVMDHNTRVLLVKVHMAFQVLAVVLMTVAGVVAYLIKEANSKPHFTTTHSWISGVSATLFVLGMLGGLTSTFGGKKANWQWKNPGHRISGIVAFVGAGVSVVYGIYSGQWGKTLLGPEKQYNLALLVTAAYSLLFFKIIASSSKSPRAAAKKTQ